MKKENFSELTTVELIKKKKNTKMLTGVLIGMLAAMLVVAVFSAIKKGRVDISLVAVALGLLPISIINYNSIKAIDAELGNRNIAI